MRSAPFRDDKINHLSDDSNMTDLTGVVPDTAHGYQTLSDCEDLPPASDQHSTNIARTTSDQGSDVHLSNTGDLRPSSQPISFSSTCLSSRRSTSQQCTGSIARLQRPIELNLDFNATINPLKPRSELDIRYDLVRNSRNQNKAALRSPTQLLKDRLNLSPIKTKHTEKKHTFKPPRPTLNGCILPGPAFQVEAFVGSSVRARIAKSERPAWWCKFDKLVVFDGVEESEPAGLKFHTRSSKGLSIARRRGDVETVVVPLECLHCQDMLNRSEWKYDVQVCKRGVCWDCRERCRWEMEQEIIDANDEKIEDVKTDANRVRADSVLQDDKELEDELFIKTGIEQRPMTTAGKVRDVEERLEDIISLTDA